MKTVLVRFLLISTNIGVMTVSVKRASGALNIALTKNPPKLRASSNFDPSAVPKPAGSTRKIPKNSIISEDMIDIKRPGTGILPKFYDKILGSKTVRDISEDEPITWEDLDLYDEKQ